MKVISIQEPYATLISLEKKQIETKGKLGIWEHK